MRRSLPILLVSGLFASAAGAQNNDHLYRGWRWQEDPGSPRAAGLAGAFVAIADDASAAVVNPAGLVTLPRSEAMASVLRRGSGTIGPGDPIASSTGAGLIGGTMAFGSRVVGAVHFSEPHEVNLALSQYPLPDRTFDQGFLDARVRTLGVAAAYQWGARVRIGAGVARHSLALLGVDSLYRRAGPELTHVRTQGEDAAVTAVGGVLYDARPDLRLGLAARLGASWAVERKAHSPLDSNVIDPGSSYRVSTPDVYSAGAAYRVVERLRVSAQVDLVCYSQIREGLVAQRGLRPQDYELDDGLEGRLGLEWAQPVKALTVQVRGGLWSQAPGSIRYVGANEPERATFLGSERRLLKAVGASALFDSGLSLDGAAVFGGDRTLVLAGARYRF